ncbi:hypothetical protein ACFL67_03265 [candidate division KSB1 bacterium]
MKFKPFAESSDQVKENFKVVLEILKNARLRDDPNEKAPYNEKLFFINTFNILEILKAYDKDIRKSKLIYGYENGANSFKKAGIFTYWMSKYKVILPRIDTSLDYIYNLNEVVAVTYAFLSIATSEDEYREFRRLFNSKWFVKSFFHDVVFALRNRQSSTHILTSLFEGVWVANKRAYKKGYDAGSKTKR